MCKRKLILTFWNILAQMDTIQANNNNLVLRLFRLLYVEPPSLSLFFPFCVTGRGSGGNGASGGGLVMDVSIDGGDGWWLECSKSITRENRERLGPQKKSNLFSIFYVFFEFFGQFSFWFFKCFFDLFYFLFCFLG